MSVLSLNLHLEKIQFIIKSLLGDEGKGGGGIFMAKEAQVFRIYNDPLMQVWVFHPVSRDDRRRIQLLQDYKFISVHPLCTSGICTLEKIL